MIHDKIQKAAEENWRVTEAELLSAWEYAGPTVENVDMTEQEAIDWISDKIACGIDGAKAGYMMRKKLIREND